MKTPEELAALIEKIRTSKGGFKREDLEDIGIPWPPRKGWRKKLLRDVEKQKKAPPKPSLTDGWLVRKTGTGRAHRWSGGQTLCRSTKGDRYIFVAERPAEIAICTMCSGLMTKDPQNKRNVSRKNDPFYQTWQWKKARFETIKRWGAKCMCCGSEHYIVVDHVKPRRRYPGLALDLDNLQVLCNDCNQGKSYDDETDFRPNENNAAELAELQIMHEGSELMH